MKSFKIAAVALTAALAAFALAGCEQAATSQTTASNNAANANASNVTATNGAANEASVSNAAAASNGGQTADQAQAATNQTLTIQANGTTFHATLANNSSVDALVSLLQEGPLTLHMSDFSNFEKVGELPQTLPRNDQQISTGAGDLILYQGNKFVIYYGENNWDFTYLGHVDGATKEALLDAFGAADVDVTLSL